MAISDNNVTQILDYDVDFKKRRIYFGALIASNDEDGSEFTWRSVERAVRHIHIMESDAPSKPIELHMSSIGGDTAALLRLYDVIQSCSCQIKFIGGGEISSSATWIMASCDERMLYPNTCIIIHDSGWGEAVSPEKLIDKSIMIDNEKLLQHKLNQIYADNSIMPLEFWAEMVKRDLYLTAEEAIMLGLADKIIQPRKRGSLRRNRIASMKQERDKKDMSKMLKMLKDRIYMDKLSKLELHLPEEKFDKTLIIDNTIETFTAEVPSVTDTTLLKVDSPLPTLRDKPNT
jgi:ATP-dependent Clp protease protease subunit